MFLPGKSHGWRSLAGYSPWDHKELDTTDFTFQAPAKFFSVVTYLFNHCTMIQVLFILMFRMRRDFPEGPVAKTPRSQCRQPESISWSGYSIPHATAESSHAATKDPTWCNEGRTSHMPQQRPSPVKETKINKNEEIEMPRL